MLRSKFGGLLTRSGRTGCAIRAAPWAVLLLLAACAHAPSSERTLREDFAACADLSAHSGEIVYWEGPRDLKPSGVPTGGITNATPLVQIWHAKPPSEVDRYERSAHGEALLPSSAVLFAGTLRNPKDDERLVEVLWDSRVMQMDAYISLFGVGVDRISPAGCAETVFARMFQAKDAGESVVCNGRKIFRLYFGHVDPTDRHSVLIPYSDGDDRGEIRGTLVEGDKLTIAYISGPGFVPSQDRETLKPGVERGRS